MTVLLRVLFLFLAAMAVDAALSVNAILAKFRTVEMPFHAEALAEREKQMVNQLVEANRLLDDVYWRQSDTLGLQLYRTTPDKALKSLLMIMGSRWDLVDENQPFAGAPSMPPGRDLYPHDLTRAKLDEYLKIHPEDKAGIYDPYTVVKRHNDRLVSIPYRQEFKTQLDHMAQALREAALLSADQAFAHFLNMRADALLKDDYYASDLAWLDLKNPKFDVIFAPYETYLDDLLGVKTSFGGAVLIRNEAESSKLAVYQKYVPDIEDALPVEASARPSKKGHLTPMEVMDSPYRAGDLRHGYQAVADNLPNDPRIHQEKGTKKIFFKNFLDARVTYVVLPIAKKLMDPAQAAKTSADGYMAFTLMHEISHELGPDFAHRAGKQVDIREAIGPAYSGLEEAKADVVGMYGLKWLVNHGFLPHERLEEYYDSYVAGIFRTLRFGTGEAHGRAQMMEFSYLSEQKALRFANGRYEIDMARIPQSLTMLAKELLEIEASGDRPRAEAWFAKYDREPAELKNALAATSDVPVDIDPHFAFADRVE